MTLLPLSVALLAIVKNDLTIVRYVHTGPGSILPLTVVLKPWPAGHMCLARPSAVAREAIFIGKKT